MLSFDRDAQHGQAIAFFALALTALVLGTAVVVDGGFAYAQRRETQNAADFAAMAGTRIVGQSLTGQPPGSGTAANVRNAITSVLSANDAQLASARYVDETGADLGDVMTAGSIPSSASGVVVDAKSNWRPFLLGLIGVIDWQAGARATAITPGESVGGGVLPVGIDQNTYDALTGCPVTGLNPCVEQRLTSGQLNIPGGFGWLTFGINGPGQRCAWNNSLGMDGDGSCGQDNPYLQDQIGPPADSHGCCTEVGLEGSVDRIGSLTGNTWGDLSWYIDNKVPVWVPIYDINQSDEQGAGAYYGIVGFGAIMFADSGHGNGNHARWLKGAKITKNAQNEPLCPVGSVVPGRSFCTAPGGAFKIDVTGEVRLVR